MPDATSSSSRRRARRRAAPSANSARRGEPLELLPLDAARAAEAQRRATATPSDEREQRAARRRPPRRASSSPRRRRCPIGLPCPDRGRRSAAPAAARAPRCSRRSPTAASATRTPRQRGAEQPAVGEQQEQQRRAAPNSDAERPTTFSHAGELAARQRAPAPRQRVGRVGARRRSTSANGTPIAQNSQPIAFPGWREAIDARRRSRT